MTSPLKFITENGRFHYTYELDEENEEVVKLTDTHWVYKKNTPPIGGNPLLSIDWVYENHQLTITYTEVNKYVYTGSSIKEEDKRVVKLTLKVPESYNDPALTTFMMTLPLYTRQFIQKVRWREDVSIDQYINTNNIRKPIDDEFKIYTALLFVLEIETKTNNMRNIYYKLFDYINQYILDNPSIVRKLETDVDDMGVSRKAILAIAMKKVADYLNLSYTSNHTGLIQYFEEYTIPYNKFIKKELRTFDKMQAYMENATSEEPSLNE